MDPLAPTTSRRAGAVLLVASAVLAGCLSSKPPAPRYYKDGSKFYGIGGDHARVEFALHVSPAPGSSTPRMTQLPERALAALVEAYGKDAEQRKKMPALLAAPLSTGSKAPSFDDSLIRFKKRFTFTIVPRSFHPADRLYSATLKAMAPEGWRFTGWSGFSAKDRTVNLAKVESSLSQTYGASLTLAPPQIAELSEAGLEASQERSTSVEQELSFEIIEFLPRLDDETAELTLNAPFPQVNVAGSYSVDVSFEYRSPDVQRFVDFTFKTGNPTGHRLRNLRYVPDLFHKDLGCIPNQVLRDITLTYVERRVFDPTAEEEDEDEDSGAATADEGDDKATYREKIVTAHGGTSTASPCEVQGVSLLDTEEVEAMVVVALHKDKPVFFYDLYAFQRPEDAQCLVFRDGVEAQAFGYWVKGGPVARVSGGSEYRRPWKLQIERDGQRVDLDGAELKDKVPPFVFRSIMLNNALAQKSLKDMGCF